MERLAIQGVYARLSGTTVDRSSPEESFYGLLGTVIVLSPMTVGSARARLLVAESADILFNRKLEELKI